MYVVFKIKCWWQFNFIFISSSENEKHGERKKQNKLPLTIWLYPLLCGIATSGQKYVKPVWPDLTNHDSHTHTKPLCKYRSCAPFFSSQQDTGKHGSCMRNIQVFLNCFKGKLGWAYVVKLKWAKFVHVNITSVWIKVYQLFSSEQLWHRPQFWEPKLSLSRGGCKAVWSADHTKESWSLTKSRL